MVGELFGYRTRAEMRHILFFLSRKPELLHSVRLFISSRQIRNRLGRTIRLIHNAQFGQLNCLNVRPAQVLQSAVIVRSFPARARIVGTSCERFGNRVIAWHAGGRRALSPLSIAAALSATPQKQCRVDGELVARRLGGTPEIANDIFQSQMERWHDVALRQIVLRNCDLISVPDRGIMG